MTAFDGRAAVITGGASGLGLATARALRERGAGVLVADLQEPPDGLAFVRADVREPDDWRAIVATAQRELGGIDLAFLNAGVASREHDIASIEPDEIRRMVDVNVVGVALGASAVVPAIEARGGGAIVATASLAGLIAFAPDPLYGMTKHAVVGYVRAAAAQLRAKGITINALCPGIVDTPILTASQRAAVVASELPIMAPEQIADAVLQLAVGEETGGAWVCQYGRPPILYRYRGVPGPEGGARPPDEMRGTESG